MPFFKDELVLKQIILAPGGYVALDDAGGLWWAPAILFTSGVPEIEWQPITQTFLAAAPTGYARTVKP